MGGVRRDAKGCFFRKREGFIPDAYHSFPRDTVKINPFIDAVFSLDKMTYGIWEIPNARKVQSAHERGSKVLLRKCGRDNNHFFADEAVVFLYLLVIHTRSIADKSHKVNHFKEYYPFYPYKLWNIINQNEIFFIVIIDKGLYNEYKQGVV